MPIFIVMLFIFGWKQWAHPAIVKLIQSQVPKLNQAQNIADFSFENFDFSVLRMQVQVTNIEVSFKKEFSAYQKLILPRIKAQINPFDLLIGRINVSAITVDNLKWQVSDEIFSGPSSQAKLPLDALFKQLPEIPVERVRLFNSEIVFKSKAQNLTLQFLVDSVTIDNLQTRLQLTVNKLLQTVQFQENASIKIQSEIGLLLNREELIISKLNVKTFDSELKVTGKLTNFANISNKPEGQFRITSSVLCEDLRTLYLSLFPQRSRIPSVSGRVEADGQIGFSGLQDINALLELKTVNLTMEQFKFGSAQIKAQVKKNQLLIDQIKLEHPAGMAELNEIEIQQTKPYQFKTNVNVSALNLQKLFVSVGLTDLPADLNLLGNAACFGQLVPPFDIECETNAELADVQIKGSTGSNFSILKLKKVLLDGTVLFNDEDIQFDSQVQIGESAGLAKGIVDFNQGFKIDFETERLRMQDVESLAGLDFTGEIKLKGSSWGTAAKGIVESEVIAENATIEKFILGNFSTELVYDSSHLYFRNLNGKLGSSNYAGSLDFDFGKSLVEGKIQIPKLSAEDVYTTLNNKFSLPFEFSGQGNADIRFSGPFDFWKLTYDLRSQVRQGQIATESFERLDLNLSADGKRIKFADVQLKKLKSVLVVDGAILTEKTPTFQLSVKTNSAFLEEIDSAIKFLPTLTGQIFASGKVTGPVASPEVALDFNTKAVTLDGVPYAPSQGLVAIDKKHLLLDGQFFGRQLQSSLKWPWKITDDFALKLQVRDLNPLLLLPLVSLPVPNAEFYSRVNLDLDLKGPSVNMQSATGFVKLSDFLLQRGSIVLKLAKPIQVTFDSGLKKLDPLLIAGDGNTIAVKLLSSNKNETKLDVAVGLKLRILQFLVPFIDSLNGQLNAQAQITLNSGPVLIFGDGTLVDGAVKFKGFPTALDNISTPIEFSKSKIFLSTIKANLGQTDVVGNGVIDIKGAKNVAVQLQAQADNLELTFPDRVTTAGRAEINFSGNWLPYTLKINYKVNRGLVEKDFGEDQNSVVSSIKASRFLPPKRFEQLSPSLLLDILVDASAGVVVKNQLLEGSASGILKIKGSPENPILLGKIELKPGSKIIFKDKPFEVQTANLQFTEVNGNMPDIYISALARISDYDINLLVQGVPNKNMVLKPTSQPPLSEPDIFSLLALGMTSTKLDQNLSSKVQQEQTSIELLASITNQSTINKKIQEKLGLNVQLAPSVDSTRNIAVPKVVVSRKLLKKLNASYARPLSGDNQNHEVKLHYLFNPSWSGILNYQNKETSDRDTTLQKQNQNEGVLGGDLEYKKEFKW